MLLPPLILWQHKTAELELRVSDPFAVEHVTEENNSHQITMPDR